MKLIEIKNICKNYNSNNVLNNISFDILRGEMISIVGKSGAGKSTLLHIIGTIKKFDKGSIIINGNNINYNNSDEISKIRNTNIGFVFQNNQLLPEFTSIENVCIPAMIKKDNFKTSKLKAKKLFDLLDISSKSDKKPNELSSGEQQRVAIARALINDPLIILADEPTGNLDKENSNTIYSLFKKLNKELNQTFAIVTHDNEIPKFCDSVYEIKNRKLMKIK